VESDDSGGNGDVPPRKFGALGRFLKPRRRAAVVVVAVGAPSAAAVIGSRLLTDFWWFAQIGHAGVFWRILVLKAEIFAVVGGRSATDRCSHADDGSGARLT
jgi:hypothetical protein